LQWLSEGLRDKDIGPLIGLTTRSVGRIVREICDKLDARTRTQAACMFLIQLVPYSAPPARLALAPSRFENHPPQA
jgi:DNA-binding CsgD family transcriptional regulator